MFENDYYENFSNCIITIKDLSKKKFVKCNFQSADFTDIETIFKCAFDSCNFLSAQLNGVHVLDSEFLSCKFKYTNFFATVLDECKMTGSEFTDSDSLSQIVGGDWSSTVLRYLNFTKQKFEGTRFSGADLTGCRFDRCKIKNCEFNESIMHETNFFGSDIRGSSFNNIDFAGINLKNAKVDFNQCITIAESLMEVMYVGENEN
jgi:fluoroquinolone resistance protein